LLRRGANLRFARRGSSERCGAGRARCKTPLPQATELPHARALPNGVWERGEK
jgi:hypothetical protein